MLYLLNFFEETTENPNGWITWVILGVLMVGLIAMMIIPQRKQKKKAQEMMATLKLGSLVTTIGGIVGEVVELDDKYIYLLTGTGDNKTSMQFVRQAIHSVAPAAGSPEAIAEAKAEKSKEDELDEIK